QREDVDTVDSNIQPISESENAIASTPPPTETQNKDTTPLEVQNKANRTKFQADKLPQIPQILADLSIVKPLNTLEKLGKRQNAIASDLIPQNNPTINLKRQNNTSQSKIDTPIIQHSKSQNKSSSKTPESWSNLAELVADNSSQNNRNESAIAPLQMKSAKPQNADKTMINDSNSHTSNIIQRLIENDTNLEPNTSQELAEIDDTSEIETTQNLELLAKEIYNLLRQRLAIERERRGSYYSDRLP
ncbi:MAG: hypothetical protein SAJ12_09740, partial [Jaaginema sp. PMC 1079.18]|nr:hypothetical protein [Jaaginema sp. PMC 1079.18]MEC4867599.1 hypothetical protein [Jaaginema sp. PMC 1078.18]